MNFNTNINNPSVSSNRQRYNEEDLVDETVRVSLVLPTILMTVIDEQRGDIPINRYIKKILIAVLNDELIAKLNELRITSDDVGIILNNDVNKAKKGNS